MKTVLTRRFYFDDGKSRKRWQITQTGKSVTTQFGRLTGKLRASKRISRSPVEAQKLLDQLVAEKLREGYVEVAPKRLEVIRNKGVRAANEKQVSELESSLGCKLPTDFRNFLTSVNGGRPNPDCVQVPGVPYIANVGVGTFFHLRPSKPGTDEITYEVKRTNELLPKGHLPIAGSSDLFTISLSPKSFGAVYWWNHETEELDDDGNFLATAAYLLASSFDEFLTRIACFFDEHEEANQQPSPSAQATKSTLRDLLRTIRKEHSPQTVIEIKRLITKAGELSQIEDRKWPFINLRNPEILQLLLNAGLRPEVIDTEGHSLLWQCASSPECIELLGKCGVDFNRRCGSDGETPLMRAIYLKQPDAIKKLVKLGANPTLRLDKHLAAQLKRDPKLSKLVEKAKADWHNRMAKNAPTSRPADGKITVPAVKGPKPSLTKLLRMLKHDRILENEIIEGLPEMIAAVGDISGIENGQWPAIDKFEDPQLLECLLRAGLNPNITDKKGNPILYQCAPHPDCLALLLKAGANANGASSKGETALMRAAYVGDIDCVQVLLDGGADPTIEFTPFARVMIDFNDEMSAFVEKARKRWISSKQKK
ncbi:MAG: ankyrin repeat domain-containing protein [Pirellulaceae bacterium]